MRCLFTLPVIENRRQKLAERAKLVKTEHPELVKSDKENADEEKSEKSSGSDKEQTSESEIEASGDEKEAHSSEEGGAKSEQGGAKVESASEEEKVESDIDLADDVDIELEAGDRGSDDNFGSEGSDKNEEQHDSSDAHKSDSKYCVFNFWKHTKYCCNYPKKWKKGFTLGLLEMQPKPMS